MPDFLEDSDSEWTTMSWLETLDDETLGKVRHLADIFFQNYEDDVPVECVEYLFLSYKVASEETGRPTEDLTSEEKEDSLIGLNLFANFESLRRKGLVEVEGSGKVTEFRYNNTTVMNTTAGDMYRSAVRTMQELSDGVQE
jgi:hypothetical protein